MWHYISTEGIEKIKVNSSYHQLKEPVLFKDNFLSWFRETKFDILGSFGFIEHFKNVEFVVKNADLVKNKGLVIISIPNFTN